MKAAVLDNDKEWTNVYDNLHSQILEKKFTKKGEKLGQMELEERKKDAISFITSTA